MADVLAGGTANANYMIYTPEHQYYTLTMLENFDHHSAGQLAEITNLLQGKVPTPRALAKKDGTYTASRLGRPVLMKPFWSGWVPAKSVGLSFDAGKLLKALHQVEMPQEMQQRRSRPPENWRKMSGKWDREITSWIEKAEKESLPRLEKMPRVLIHGDVFPDNLLADTGRPLALLDPECFAYEPRELDLGIALIGLCAEENQWKPERIAALLKGYDQPIDRAALQAAVTWGGVRLGYHRYLKYQVINKEAKKPRDWREIKELSESFNPAWLPA